MLEEKTYSISELAAIIGGSSDRQAIKRKLERRHILYSIQGRGSKATFKIEKIPSPFQEFCMDVLKFDKNTDFEKLRNLYYYCLNDELFMAKPDEEKAMLLEDKGKHISRQTIAGYEAIHKFCGRNSAAVKIIYKSLLLFPYSGKGNCILF